MSARGQERRWPCQGHTGTRERAKHSEAFARPEERTRIDFASVNCAALAALPAILERWLPDGQRRGNEWVARNPTRADRRAGSFKVNLRTGKWSDFAVGDKGGDPISLAAYLRGLTQAEAARRLADMLGVR